MRPVVSKQVPTVRFEPFVPLRVLCDYDGPRTFTFRDYEGELFLAHWSEEDAEGSRFVVVPFSDHLVHRLEHGLVSVLDALNQPRVYVVECLHDGTVSSAGRLNIDAFPTDALPAKGAMLYADLEPIARVKATGEQIKEGSVPHAVIRTVAEGLPRAALLLLDYELGSIDAPDEYLQRFRTKSYEPVAQEVLVASFEIAFRQPAVPASLFEGLDASVRRDVEQSLTRAGELLRIGLRWAMTSDATPSSLRSTVKSDGEARVILEALDYLTPMGRGPIREMEISGRWVGRPKTPIKLTRATRKLVADAIKQLPRKEQVRVSLTGRIREMDKDRSTFELREIVGDGPPSRKFVFDEESEDAVNSAWDRNLFVKVEGIQSSANKPARVYYVSPLDAE